jgi:hypothetical protein
VILKKAVFPQSGSIVFWGDIFGGRYGENRHWITHYEHDETQKLYYMYFDENEKCTIYDPKMIECGKNSFVIKDAARIVWEWYYYGREKTVSNLNSLDYKKISLSLVSVERCGNLATDPKIKTFEIQNQPALKFY